MIFVGQEIVGLNLRKLTSVKSIHFQSKIVVLILVTTALVSLTLALPGIFWLPVSLILGLAYAHAVELQHQCLHTTAYKSRIWNRIVGITLGLPLLVSFSDYKNSHLKHHRLLGTPEDKEFFNYSYQNLTSVYALIPHMWMVRHYRDVLGYISTSAVGKLVRKNESPLKTAKKIRFEYQLMALFLVTMAALTLMFQTPIFLKVWLIPFLAGIPTHALIELPEHIGCNVRTPDVCENTRTIKAGKFAVWFVHGNNYHVEHHWLPGVPNDKFPLLHTHIAKKIEYFEPSYWSFYRKFFKSLQNKDLHRPWNRKTKPLARGN